jgi:hypothetical protein
MGIVRQALRRPYSFLVASILVLPLGFSALLRAPTDVFPTINIPVVTVVLYYGGLAPPNPKSVWVVTRNPLKASSSTTFAPLKAGPRRSCGRARRPPIIMQ